MKKLLDLYHKIPIQAKLTFWTFACTLVQRSISLITVPIFTRLLTTEQYGQYSIYMSWLNIFSIFTSLRLYAGVYNKGLSKYKGDMDGYALTMQYTTSILTLCTAVVYFLFKDAFNRLTDLSTPLMVLMLLELFFMTPMTFWTVRQRYDFKYKSVVAATLVLSIFSPVLGIIAVSLSDEKGIARIVSAAAAQIIVGIFFYVHNMVKGRFRFKKEYAKFALIFNLPLLPHYFSEYILNQSDRVMIQKFCGYAEAAIYSVAYNTGMVMTMVSSSINQALVPWLYQTLDKKDFQKIKKYTLQIGILVAIAMGIFVLVAPELALIMGGKNYALAKYIIPPVTVSIYFTFWYTLFANVEFYYDKNKYTMYISILGAIANIVLNAIFIPLTSFIAAAYTSLVCYILYSMGHYYLMSKVFYKREGTSLFDIRKIILTGVALIGFMFVALLIYDYAILRYLLLIVAAIVIFICRNKLMALAKSVNKKSK